jgi:dipeptidyl aminopeptidase/acylaminoacyl peptidase
LDWDGSSYNSVRDNLAILAASSGAILNEAPAAYNLVGLDTAFSWSPGGDRIAFSALHSATDASDPVGPGIYAWDLRTHEIETLVDRSGPNFDPRWSPDGNRIAYLTADGQDMFKNGLKLAVQSTSGPDRLILSKPDEMTGTPYLPTWIDADHLAYVAMRQMECPVFKVDASHVTTSILGRQPLSCFGGVRIGADGTLFMTRHSLDNPSEVVSTNVHQWAPMTLTGRSTLRLPWRAEAISWQSRRAIMSYMACSSGPSAGGQIGIARFGAGRPGHGHTRQL